MEDHITRGIRIRSRSRKRITLQGRGGNRENTPAGIGEQGAEPDKSYGKRHPGRGGIQQLPCGNT